MCNRSFRGVNRLNMGVNRLFTCARVTSNGSSRHTGRLSVHSGPIRAVQISLSEDHTLTVAGAVVKERGERVVEERR